MNFSNKQKGILALIGLAFTYASFGEMFFAVIISFMIYREIPSIKDFFRRSFDSV